MTRPFVPYARRLKRRAQSLRREQTPAERKLWYEFLRTFPHKVTRQKRLGKYIADFYCASRKLVIEVDGDSHFDGSARRYDESRTLDLQALGISVLRFTNLDVMRDFEGVCDRIAEALDAK